MPRKGKRGRPRSYPPGSRGPKPAYQQGEMESCGIQRFTRRQAMAQVIETAIWLWVIDRDPLSTHFLVMSQYNCLLDLAPVVKGPFTAMCLDLRQVNVVYDFLRHADNDSKKGISGVDFMPNETPCLLFDVICSFEDYFGVATPFMMAFLGYFPFWFKQNHPALSNAVCCELPKSLDPTDFVGLSKKAAFVKLAKAFFEGPLEGPI